MKIPKECYEEYGKDLDSCSTQELKGCGRCILANPKVVSRAKKFVITKIEAIEIVLDTVETQEEDCKWCVVNL